MRAVFGLTGVAMVWAICYPIMVLLFIGSTRSITGISVRDVIGSQPRCGRRPLHGPGGPGDSIMSSARSVSSPLRLEYVDPGGRARLCWGDSDPCLGIASIGNVRSLWREFRYREVSLDATLVDPVIVSHPSPECPSHLSGIVQLAHGDSALRETDR